MKAYRVSLYSILLLTVLLTACSLAGEKPISIPVTTLIETPTGVALNIQPTFTSQSVSKPTLSSTETPVPTQPRPTWTVQPTLTGNEAIDAVNRMIATNGGCKLPCWWGIMPGQTSWENALILLSTFSPNIKNSGPFDLIRDDNTHHTVIDYFISYKVPNNRIGRGASITVLDNIVSIIYVGSESTGEIFSILNLLSEYGEPTSVFIKTYSDTPTGILPFYIVLYYPDSQFLAIFELEGNKIGEFIRVCYKPITPRIYLWSKDESAYVNNYRISDWVLGSNNTGLKSIEESSSLDAKVFYQQFINATNNTCIETPSSMW